MKTALIPVALVTAALWLAGCQPIAVPAASTTTTAPETAPTTTVALTPTPEPIILEQAQIADVVEEGSLPLAGSWRFAKVPSFTPDIAAPGYDDSSWVTVDAPARWTDQGLGADVGTGAVVVYRRTIDAPADWAGQPIGISAWFNPYATQVFVNGERVEPLRTPFAPYGDVSTLIKPGAPNTITVVTQYDGLLDYRDAGAARIGPIGTRPVTQVVHDEGSFATAKGDAPYVLIHPTTTTRLPALLLVASGSHGMAELDTWFDTADDLARRGFVSMAAALPTQTADAVEAAVAALRQSPLVDPQAIYLFGVEDAAKGALDFAASDAGADVRGVILLSPPMLQKLPNLGDRPLLLMAAEKYRGGLVLNQLRKLAAPLGAPAQVIALPGDGNGTFLLTNIWNAVRDAVTGWLIPSRPL